MRIKSELAHLTQMVKCGILVTINSLDKGESDVGDIVIPVEFVTHIAAFAGGILVTIVALFFMVKRWGNSTDE